MGNGQKNPAHLPMNNRQMAHKSPVNQENRNKAVEGIMAGLMAGQMAGVTGLEPATSGVTGRRSNQLSYSRNRKRAP